MGTFLAYFGLSGISMILGALTVIIVHSREERRLNGFIMSGFSVCQFEDNMYIINKGKINLCKKEELRREWLNYLGERTQDLNKPFESKTFHEYIFEQHQTA